MDPPEWTRQMLAPAFAPDSADVPPAVRGMTAMVAPDAQHQIWLALQAQCPPGPALPIPTAPATPAIVVGSSASPGVMHRTVPSASKAQTSSVAPETSRIPVNGSRF